MDLPLDLRHASITEREATRAVLTLVLEPPGNDNRHFEVFVRPSTLQSDRLQGLDHTRQYCHTIDLGSFHSVSKDCQL